MIKPDKDWADNINNVLSTRSLNLRELDCPCCHLLMVTVGIWRVAVEVKAEYGDDIVIISCFRCEIHNLREKGAEDSRHLYGEAIDLQPRNKKDTDITDRIMNRYKNRYRVIKYEDPNYLHIQVH